MAGIHKLVKSEFHAGSFSGYQYYRECSCGWACRVGTEQQADSQYKGHQLNNGYVESVEEATEPKNTQEQAAAKANVVIEEKKVPVEVPVNPSGNASSEVNVLVQAPTQ